MNAITLAGIQIATQFGKVQDNLCHADRMIEAAAQKGAQLVVMPELMPSGYALSQELWDLAEPAGGRIEDWLCETARRLNIYLGTSYLQVEIGTWLVSLLAGLITGMLALRRQDWVLPLVVGLAAVITLLVLTFLFPALWLRILLAVILALAAGSFLLVPRAFPTAAQREKD